MLEGNDDFSVQVYLQIKYQTYYNHTLYSAWSSSLVQIFGTEFSSCGNNYIISKIDVENIGLMFILSQVLIIPNNQ